LQGLAGGQQLALADDFIHGFRAQNLG